MKAQAITGNYSDANVEAIAVAIFKDEKADSPFIKELDLLTGGIASSIIKNEEIKGNSGDTALIRFAGKTKATRLLLIGVGDEKEYDAAETGVLAGTAARFLSKRNIKSFVLVARSNADAGEIAQQTTQTVITSLYSIDKYKTKDKNDKTIKDFVLCIEGADEKAMKAGIERGQIIGDSMNFTRDMCNEPANILHPTEMANRAETMAKETGLSCEILDEATMEKLGMGSLLSVSIGSEQPPKMIVLKYEPKKSTGKKGELLALVGKGVCFDTGGISLKPAENMDAMKYDMSGGGTVIGAMRAIAMLKPSVPVLGVVAAVENMPSGKATRPGDVVTAMTGKTIEVLNTDAEGRLILADAVAYAEKQGATTIVDLATLTGAVIVALGDLNAGVLGNDQPLIDDIIACGKETGEGFWQLPVGAGYSKQIKSDIADIKNIGTRGRAGTIAGAVFIQEFVDKAKWAHLDIAGTAWADSDKPHQSKGPTAMGIRTLVKMVEKSQ
jgi:leucyl aminopeptidase